MEKEIAILIVCLVGLVHSTCDCHPNDLIVTLPDGKVQGTTYYTTNNVKYYGFQGIPYAIPPVGELRLESPQPNKPWSGIWDATADSKSCISINHFFQSELESEDCLYVNVYVPAVKAKEKLPVMFWIYGGSFVEGTSAKFVYGPDFLIEENVIMVSFNYRVGPLGFLSTGDKVLPGNYGLKDQSLALKWTSKNIEYFGGDPEKITIFGESAGGASTGLHLLSKLSAGLFRAAIVQSGSAVNDWSVEQDPKTQAFSVANNIPGGDYGDDTQALKDFMKERTIEEIVKATVSLWPTIEVESEDAFLTGAPYQMLESGDFAQVPIMIGICSEESLLFLDNLNTAKEFAAFFDAVPLALIPKDLNPNPLQILSVIQDIRNIYLSTGQTFSSNLVGLAEFYSDYLFNRGIIKHAELASSYIPVYFYQFSYYGRPFVEAFIDGAGRAGHAAELPFIFNVSFNSQTARPEDLLTQNRMTKLWTNFAKYLDPTPEKSDLLENIIWPTFDNKTMPYLDIDDKLETFKSIKKNIYPPWVDIFETYGTKPFITF